MVGGDAVTLCKAQNAADGNAVDDLSRGKPVDLLGKDMFQPGVIVREGLPHLLAAVKALDDFRNVQAGLHVGVQEGLAGVIEAAGVFLLQQVHHLFHHPLGGEDLVGFLGWDVVEDVLGAALIKVIRQLDLQVQKFLHRIVKHHRVEQVACKMFLLSGGLVDVRPTVPQKAELLQRDAGDLLKDLVRDDPVKIRQRHSPVAVGHEEGWDGAGEAPEVVTDGVLAALFLLLLLVGLHSAHDGLLHLLRRLLDGGLQVFHQSGGALLLQLVVLAAEILGAFHVLQADELNALIQFLALCGGIQIALLVQHMGLPGKGIHMADEQIAGLPAQKAHIVAVSAVGDGWTVGDDEHRLCIDLLAEVVDGEGLAKVGLGVPEIFPAGVALVIGLGVADSPFLFFSQGVGDGGIQLHPAPVHSEILKIPPGLLPIQMEPLVFAVVLHVQLAEVGMEIVVGEHLTAAVIVDGIAPPLLVEQYIGGVGLLFQAFVHRLLGVADLRPAVVPGNFRGGIGVDHGHHLPGSARGYASHYAISFIMLCMNATSSEVSLYFENSSSSVHALEKS